jgi:hypothetical protein
MYHTPSQVGIGIDEQTAIAIDSAGKGTVLRQSTQGGRVYVFTPGRKAEACEPGRSLEYTNVTVQKLDTTETFDFVTLEGGDAAQRCVGGDGSALLCHAMLCYAWRLRGCTSNGKVTVCFRCCSLALCAFSWTHVHGSPHYDSILCLLWHVPCILTAL